MEDTVSDDRVSEEKKPDEDPHFSVERTAAAVSFGSLGDLLSPKAREALQKMLKNPPGAK